MSKCHFFANIPPVYHRDPPHIHWPFRGTSCGTSHFVVLSASSMSKLRYLVLDGCHTSSTPREYSTITCPGVLDRRACGRGLPQLFMRASDFILAVTDMVVATSERKNSIAFQAACARVEEVWQLCRTGLVKDFFYSRQLPACVGKLYKDAIGCSLALREVTESSNFNFLRRKTLEALERLLYHILINGFGDHAIRLSRDRVQEELAAACPGKRLMGRARRMAETTFGAWVLAFSFPCPADGAKLVHGKRGSEKEESAGGLCAPLLQNG